MPTTIDNETELSITLFSEAQEILRMFATSPHLDFAAAAAFGSGVTGSAVGAAIDDFERTGWPRLVLVDEHTLNGARGAYDRFADTIYLSRQFVTQASPAAITAVLIEEIGHAIDVRVNATDAPGDEGEIFANLVLGHTLDADALAALRAENDYGTIGIDGVATQVELAAPIAGSITLDGSLADWTAADQIDASLSASGYDIYAKATGGSYVFALKAPVAIGADTTAWLNTDQNASTGYKIWGFAGGAEYNINIDVTGTPRLYTGADGQTLIAGASVLFGYSADRTVVEFAVSADAIGSPGAINTLWDINNNTFLPTDYSATQYAVIAEPALAPAPVVGSVTLDGNLADWTAADQIDKTLSASGYDIYAKATDASYVFAVKAPVAIGANTTVWLNTDQDAGTGYKIWGFAGGAEYNINFDATGTPRLYTGADGEALVSGASVLFAYSADRTVVEFAVSASALGSPRAVNTLWDINNNTFLPTDYGATQYEVIDTGAAAPEVGSITLDGNLADWSAADQIDQTLSTSGYDIYAKATGDSFVFAIKAPVAIGANTTAWLNTDQNAETGFKIFGANGGAEYNINFDPSGVPRLYTGDAGQTLVTDAAVSYAYSADRTVVEFAVAKSAVGSPVALNTLWDVNDSTFLPTNFATTQYEVLNLPARTDFSSKIGIVYSETTANQYFSKTAYSQLFMAAQNQSAMAGVPFDILTESDLTDLAKLANYDALLFPSFSHVQSAQLTAIENTLKLLVQNYDTGLIAAGNFMTNSETGAALPGDSYARMKALLGLQLTTGGFPADVSIQAGDITHSMMQDYAAQEVIHNYSGVGWLAFAPTDSTGSTVLATQTIGGETYAAVIATTMGGRNVHFSTEAVMADKNLLWQAIDYAVNGSGVTAGLQLSRQESLVASRVDMDQAMELFEINPENGEGGIYDKMLPILQEWKNAYNFVGSYYVDIGDNAAEDQATDWTISGEYYKQLIAMGNELGSHSLSHPHFTDALTAAQIEYEFGGSKQIIEQQISAILGRPFTVDGAAVPGAPETLATAIAISQYYDYISGGFSSIGAGYPGAFGYLNPEMAGLDKVYLAPNLQFDFSLVEFRGLTPEEAAAEWQREWDVLASHSDVPVLLWPWHDYGAAVWSTDPPTPSPYTTAMFTDFIARAYAEGAEFVTLDDLAERISAFENSTLLSSVAGNTITATVSSPDAGKFALDLDNLGVQKIARVTGWYAYDDDSVFLPRDGGTYTIELGAAPDDVTRIISLPMRAELLSLTGDGTMLTFSLFGEGRMVIDLTDPAGREAVVTGASVVSLAGDKLTIDVGALGQHDVSVALGMLNQLPTITSDGGGASASITISENAIAVTTVTATDANAGQVLTYAIAGGADADRFTINSQSGVLEFASAPDYERPADQGANNIYDVVVAASDSAGAFDSQALAVAIANVGGITLTGNKRANTLTGTGEEDTLSGRGGGDTLFGLGGNDRLMGNAGPDVLVGGDGADTLTGGTGSDRFDYNAITEGGDTITDFTRGTGGDRLDIRDILVGYNAGSALGDFVSVSGGAATMVSVNADGIGTDFVELVTLQNVAMSANLLNDMMAQDNLIVA